MGERCELTREENSLFFFLFFSSTMSSSKTTDLCLTAVGELGDVTRDGNTMHHVCLQSDRRLGLAAIGDWSEGTNPHPPPHTEEEKKTFNSNVQLEKDADLFRAAVGRI